MEYVIEVLKKLRGVLAMSLIWWIGHWYYSKELVGAVASTPEAWKTTSHYMIFLFVLVVLCLIVRTRLVLTGVALYGFAFCAQQISFVFDKHSGLIDWTAEKITPMFMGIRYIADQIGFGLGELAECGLGAFYGLFIGVVACAAWCFVTPGDGSNVISRAKSRRRHSYEGHTSSGVGDPLSRRASRSDGTSRAPRTSSARSTTTRTPSTRTSTATKEKKED